MPGPAVPSRPAVPSGPVESWRVFFPTAAVLVVLGLGAWGAQLDGAPLGLTPVDHAGFMVWGVLGSGILGFLLTAFPKQNDAPMPGSRLVWGLWGAQLVAALTLLFGRQVLPPGLAAVFAVLPWLGVLAWAAPIARASLTRRWEPTTAGVPLALAAGAVGVVLHQLQTGVVRGVDVGVGPFVTLMAFAILDRVLPFFSARVTPGYTGGRRPWFLGPLAVLLWARALSPVLAPALVPWAAGLLVVLVLRQSWGWRPWPASREPMIGALHVGVGWFVLGWGAQVAGAPSSVATHALLVGGIGTLLLSLSMRVVRGHGGLPLVLGRAGLAALVLTQIAAGLRVWVGWAGGAPVVYVVSAAFLVAAFGVWLVRFGSFFPAWFFPSRVRRGT